MSDCDASGTDSGLVMLPRPQDMIGIDYTQDPQPFQLFGALQAKLQLLQKEIRKLVRKLDGDEDFVPPVEAAAAWRPMISSTSLCTATRWAQGSSGTLVVNLIWAFWGFLEALVSRELPHRIAARTWCSTGPNGTHFQMQKVLNGIKQTAIPVSVQLWEFGHACHRITVGHT